VCCRVLQCFAAGSSGGIAEVRQVYGAMCCSVLQCVAVCCSVLQCVAVFCSRAREEASNLIMSGLQCVVVCCSVL